MLGVIIHDARYTMARFSIVMLALVVGCGNSPSGHTHGDGGEPDAEQFIPCTNDPRADHFVPGLAKTGPMGRLKVVLLASDPSPPTKGNNAWTIRVEDMGTPQTGATMKITPFMPDHGHGTPTKANVSPMMEPGQYQVTPLYLYMAGLWQITLEVTTPAAKDSVVFSFCIEQ
jgi:YtkA-like